MNEFTTGKTMTVGEVAQVLGVSHDTVTRRIKELFPDLMKNGVTTFLNEAHVTAIKMAMTSQLEAITPTQSCVGAAQPKTSLEKALVKRMTTSEVCQTLGCDRVTLMRNWREIEKGAGAEPFKVIERGRGNETYWTEAEITLLLEKMKGNANNQHNLQSQIAGIETSQSRVLRLQILQKQMQDIYEAEIAELRAQAEANRPKVEFFDQVADSADALQMRDVAAALNMPNWGRNKIFEFLRKKGVLDDRNIPYRKFQDQGYFRVIEQKFSNSYGETRINLKTLVYQRGINFIRKLIKEAA